MPSTVSTTTSNVAVRFPPQRKCFYHNGRYWVFYHDGTNMVFKTSTDGTSWSNATTVAAATSGEFCSVYFDGAYVHYVRAATSLYYRRGTPNSDGTITWSADEQTAWVGDADNVAYAPTVAVDSNGYAFVSFRHREFIDPSYYYYPKVTKNANNDGTWSTASGFPYELSSTSNSAWQTIILPLTNTRMYAIYTYSSIRPYGKLWDGSVWQSQEYVTPSGYQVYGAVDMSAVNDGDDVHFLYCRSTKAIDYVKRTYGTGWGSIETVQAAGASGNGPVVCVDGSDLYAFWSGNPTANHVYYKKKSGGSWDADPTDWIDESTDQLTGTTANDRLSVFFKSYGSKIGLLYMTKTASPFNVRFACLELGGAVVKEVADSLSLSESLLTDKTFGVSDSIGVFDVSLKSWTLQVADALLLLDAVLRDRVFQVVDSFGLFDSVLRGKQFLVSDAVSLSDLVMVLTETFKEVVDAVGLTEQVLASRTLIVGDLASLADQVLRDKEFVLVDQIQLTENVFVSKILVVSDQIVVVEVVEKSVAGVVKTRIFLVLGDLAVQLTG